MGNNWISLDSLQEFFTQLKIVLCLLIVFCCFSVFADSLCLLICLAVS